jgi:adenylate cyclase
MLSEGRQRLGLGLKVHRIIAPRLTRWASLSSLNTVYRDLHVPVWQTLERTRAETYSVITLVVNAAIGLPGNMRRSTLGVTPVQVLARGVSVLGLERESVVRDLGHAGLQVWQSFSGATGRGRGDFELAILFTDLVEFSSWELEAGDAAALELLREVDAVIEAAVVAHKGRIVKRLGDGLMATFLTAQGAVDAALEAQDALQHVELDGYQPRMRAGIHWGRPRRVGGDYIGVDVNVAARVGEAAKAGQVLVSDRALARLDLHGLQTGRRKRLRAHGAPRDLRVATVARRDRRTPAASVDRFRVSAPGFHRG